MAQELIYTSCGDYLIPDIRLSYTSDKPLGKYGRMRRAYLEQNNPMLLDDLILTETLFTHLWKIDEIAHCRMERLMEELLERNPAPDKATQQLAWVQHMNMLKAQAEEIIVIKCTLDTHFVQIIHVFRAVHRFLANFVAVL